MKVLVTYYSRSGNTGKLAEIITDGVRLVDGVKCDIKPCGELEKADFLKADGIIAGSPVYFGTMTAELKDAFDRLVSTRQKMGDKVGAAFTTSGNISGGKETSLLSIHQAFLIYGMIVVGDPLDATGHYGVSCVGEPGDRTAENARRMGCCVAKLVNL